MVGDVADDHRVVKLAGEGIGVFQFSMRHWRLPGRNGARSSSDSMAVSRVPAAPGFGRRAVAGTDFRDLTVGAADKIDD